MVKAAALCLLLPSLLLAAVPPTIERPVTDTQGLLTPEQTESVARELVRLHEDTGAQMAVLIVDSTEGEPIEDYAMRAAEAWRGGQHGADNGLLYVLAVNDRRMRLDVGYGLEEYLPDDAVRRLLDAQGTFMRSGDYATALEHIIQGVRERLPARDSAPVRAPPPRLISQDMALTRVTWVAIVMSLLSCLVLRPGVRERLSGPLAAVLGGMMLAVALILLSPLAKSDPLDHGTLVRAFFMCGALLHGGAYLLRREHERWGASVMVGTLFGHLFALTQHSQGGVLFFGTLLVCTATTLAVALLSALGVGTMLLNPIVFAFGGAAAYSSWLRAETITLDSDSDSSDWDSSSSSSRSSSRSSSWGSSSSSWDSSSSSSGSSSSSRGASSSSSSSNSSHWRGGGGNFGGGGASSSW